MRASALRANVEYCSQSQHHVHTSAQSSMGENKERSVNWSRSSIEEQETNRCDDERSCATDAEETQRARRTKLPSPTPVGNQRNHTKQEHSQANLDIVIHDEGDRVREASGDAPRRRRERHKRRARHAELNTGQRIESGQGSKDACKNPDGEPASRS